MSAAASLARRSLLLLAALGLATAAAAAPALDGGTRAAVRGLVDRTGSFLASRKTAEGISPDQRSLAYPTEQLRLSVVPQLLAYHELHRLESQPEYLAELRGRADFLARNFAGALRRAPFDGMLGYAMLCAHEDTGDPRYRELGEQVVQQMLVTPLESMAPNTGLMAAMALAKSYEQTGRPELVARLNVIFDWLATRQNADGSFPHAYDGRDLHYSSWTAMELILIRRSVPAEKIPRLAPILASLTRYVRGRIPVAGPARGEPMYEEIASVADGPVGVRTHYARASASQPEYDTRGWTNELAYEVLVLAASGDQAATAASVDFLARQENGCAFPDKWAYPMDPQAPEHPWSVDGQSVIRTSLVFWTLAVALSETR